ncbi:MAG: hypothetical protein ACREP2_01670 [Rhodanobacteraceae bacterium]
MAHVELEAGQVTVRLNPLDEVLSLHGSLHMRYRDIQSVTTDPVPPALFRGFRIGTNVPGIKVAGTFYNGDGAVFYDFHDRLHCLTFELAHETYQQVVVQVDKDQDRDALARGITQRLAMQAGR